MRKGLKHKMPCHSRYGDARAIVACKTGPITTESDVVLIHGRAVILQKYSAAVNHIARPGRGIQSAVFNLAEKISIPGVIFCCSSKAISQHDTRAICGCFHIGVYTDTAPIEQRATCRGSSAVYHPLEPFRAPQTYVDNARSCTTNHLHGLVGGARRSHFENHGHSHQAFVYLLVPTPVRTFVNSLDSLQVIFIPCDTTRFCSDSPPIIFDHADIPAKTGRRNRRQ